MSRGPGAIESRLAAIFREKPSGVFATSELCSLVYGIGRVQKKHRVSVLRALKRISGKPSKTLALWREVQFGEKSDDHWFNHRYYPTRNPDCVPGDAKRPRK